MQTIATTTTITVIITGMITNKPLKIAIASGKGGTGKTLLSTNLASFLSRERKTLLVDLDVEEPNDLLFIHGKTKMIITQKKMIPEWDENKCTSCGICSDVCNYHAVVQLGTYVAVFKELCHGCYACSELCPTQALPMKEHQMGETTIVTSGNLTLIESRLAVGEEQAVPLIHKTHELVNQEYRGIPLQIFDCPPGTSCPVVAAVKETDFVVLVSEPTPFGLNDLKLAVETVRKIGKPMGVVINRYGIGNDEMERYCESIQLPLLAKIPFDKRIAEHYSNGQMVFEKDEGLRSSLQQLIAAIHHAV